MWGYGSRKWDEKGTDVRLQVFDEMCHVLTVFTFIDPVSALSLFLVILLFSFGELR